MADRGLRNWFDLTATPTGGEGAVGTAEFQRWGFSRRVGILYSSLVDIFGGEMHFITAL
jgi:hypothetical protein